ncbi:MULTISPECIES: hypothetical protein, partial [Photorhabdus]|uniref:hypothetical protein n=1 Tax=Photorhabdus TaxID=29487 RepID=UPI001E3860BB
ILPYLNEIVITKISKIEKDSKKSPDFLSGDLCMKDRSCDREFGMILSSVAGRFHFLCLFWR